MQECEQAWPEWDTLANACNEFAVACVDWLCNVIKPFWGGLDTETIIEGAAYAKAAGEHPEWVHRATCSKKKRIRKKYHDKIMRCYRREVSR